MEDKDMQEQIEKIFGIEINNNEEKIIEDIEDEVKEILNIKGE